MKFSTLMVKAVLAFICFYCCTPSVHSQILEIDLMRYEPKDQVDKVLCVRQFKEVRFLNAIPNQAYSFVLNSDTISRTLDFNFFDFAACPDDLGEGFMSKYAKLNDSVFVSELAFRSALDTLIASDSLTCEEGIQLLKLENWPVLTYIPLDKRGKVKKFKISSNNVDTLEVIQQDKVVTFYLRKDDNCDCSDIVKFGACGKPRLFECEFCVHDSLIDQSTSIKFVGAGTLQKAVQDDSEIPASTGIGFHLTENFKKSFVGFYRIDFQGTLNVASTADTLSSSLDATDTTMISINNQRQFGTALLTPISSRQGVDLELKGYLRCPWFRRFRIINGVLIRYTGSNRVIDIPGLNISDVNFSAFRFGVFHEFLNPEFRKNHSIHLGFNWLFNSIGGDLGYNDQDDWNGVLDPEGIEQYSSAKRELLFGSSKRRFNGPEVLLGLRFENLKASFSYSWSGKGEKMPGFGGGRLVTTISFVGGFPVKLTSKKD